jgi:two-component system chemotaxis response regulator CheB
MNLKVLIVDDSVLYRKILADVLLSIPYAEVVGSAANGKIAVQKIYDLRPDLITLDMEMPQMGGLEVLDVLQKSGSNVSVIVVSSLTRRGGQLTIQALEKGAFDFITKPDATDASANRELLYRALEPRLRILARSLEIRKILNKGITGSVSGTFTDNMTLASRSQEVELGSVAVRMNLLRATKKPKIVLIGVSTGGPNALTHILPKILEDIGVPILIVQHMPPLFTGSLAESLSTKCSIRVKEAVHGEFIEPNTVYIAPGGKHMGLVSGPNGHKVVQITEDPPENFCRPAVDYLFRSVANNFPGQAMAVILTGMGNDGISGLRQLKQHGCYVIAQDETSCVVYGMPKTAVDAGLTDIVLPLETIADQITALVGRHEP